MMMRQPNDLELKVANAISDALRLTSTELHNVANVNINLGVVTPTVLLAMALSSDKNIAIRDLDEDKVMKYIVACGDPLGGFTFYGPFETKFDAEYFAEVNFDADFWIAELNKDLVL